MMLNPTKQVTTMMVCMAAAWQAQAAEIYVAPGGSDANPGTKQQPFKSIAHAQEHVRESGLLGKQPVTVYLREGTYYLSDALVFTPRDSGTEDAPVRYISHEGEDVAISGGLKLDLEWEPYRDGILQAKAPAGVAMDQLFVNGERQHMARYPNYDPNVRVFNGYAEDAFSKERAARWKNPAGGYMHAIHRARWGGFHFLITGKDENGELTFEGGWQNNRQNRNHNSMRMVENIFEELDAPGEWFHSADTGVLYVYPPEGIDLDQSEVVTVQLAHLIEFQGAVGPVPSPGVSPQAMPGDAGSGDPAYRKMLVSPVSWIILEGITFRHTARTFMETKEPLLRSDWTIYRGGAVTFTGASDCTVQDCTFDSPGGNAVFVNKWNRRITVKSSHFKEVGASAVAFVGSPDAVRNPQFEYRQQNQYDEIDMTPGPKSDDYPADCLVEDCLMARTGRI
ncbi:MAG: signaling protein, partial [Gemmatimonadetes bacterium]|nr:signaling protein [Gemmatimonadota bacterium]